MRHAGWYARIVNEPTTIAVINSTSDITDLLRLALEQSGFVVVTALTPEVRDGHVNFDFFMRQHRPRVVVYDVSPPYEINYRFFEHLANVPAARDTQFVLTSTNVQQVTQLGGLHHRIYEIIGTPFDIAEMVGAVREAARARATK
jgi:DNA-binding response OmpR family regulator